MDAVELQRDCRERIAAAVAAERERWAKIVEAEADRVFSSSAIMRAETVSERLRFLAAAIRKIQRVSGEAIRESDEEGLPKRPVG